MDSSCGDGALASVPQQWTRTLVHRTNKVESLLTRVDLDLHGVRVQKELFCGPAELVVDLLQRLGGCLHTFSLLTSSSLRNPITSEGVMPWLSNPRSDLASRSRRFAQRIGFEI